MFHVLGYQASIATGVDTDLTPINDELMQIINGGFMSEEMLELFGVVGFGADAQYGKVVTPSLNCLGYDLFDQIIANTGGVSGDSDIVLRDNMPLLLKALESIKIQGRQDSAGAQNFTAVAFVGNGKTPTPGGQMFTIQGDSVGPAVANEWTNITQSWNVELPAGQYAVVGGVVVAANCFAWRINAQNCLMRPGGLPVADAGNRTADAFRFGRMGQWCTFSNTLMPKIEVLCSAATAVFKTYLDVVRL